MDQASGTTCRPGYAFVFMLVLVFLLCMCVPKGGLEEGREEQVGRDGREGVTQGVSLSGETRST